MADRTELEALTVDELRDLAADADVEGRSGMNKAGLVDALADGPAPPDTTPVAAEPEEGRPGPGIDEALAAERERLREAEAAAAADVEERPTVGGIDDVLVARRAATIEAEAEPTPVTEAP